MMTRSDHAIGWALLAAYALLVTVFVVLATLFSTRPVKSQHAQFHDHYVNWINNDGKGCCNGADCKPFAEENLTTINGELMAFVRGVGKAEGTADWCPILRKHYLSKGNAPNWSTAHACITDYYGGQTPCEQLICFQPQPAI